MAEKRSKSDQTFDFNTMTTVIYCMMKDNVVLGARHYQVMSALNGTRTASAYEHDFRNAKRQAKELFDKGDALDLKTKVNTQSKKPSDGVSPAAKPKPKGKPGEFRANSSNMQKADSDLARQQQNAEVYEKAEDEDEKEHVNDINSKKIKVEMGDELEHWNLE
jgi:hypothetical protein